jgi:hypothetical protein
MTVAYYYMGRADKKGLEPDIHPYSHEERHLDHLMAEVIKLGRHTSSACSPDRNFSMRQANSGVIGSDAQTSTDQTRAIPAAEGIKIEASVSSRDKVNDKVGDEV